MEHGVFLDEFWDGGPQRELGTRGLLDQLGRYLAGPAASPATGLGPTR